MRRTAFLARIAAAVKVRQATEQRQVTTANNNAQARIARLQKLEHDAWKVREAAWDTLHGVAEVLGGQAVVNRGGNAVELQGVVVPVRFDIEPGTNGAAITARWGEHEVERTFPSATAAGRFVEEITEHAIAGTKPVARKRTSSAL